MALRLRRLVSDTPTLSWHILPLVTLGLGAPTLSAGCTRSAEGEFNPDNPVRGPSELVVLREALPTSDFAGGADPAPAARVIPPPAVPPDPALAPEAPVCDTDCRSYCAGLGLENPVNFGLCDSLWGVGTASQPIVEEEACRRLYMDTLGRFPTHAEAQAECVGQPWGSVVARVLESPEFVKIGRRDWADLLRYDTTSVSVERIYDADRLVSWLYEGTLSYDQFTAIISAHPVLTRKFATEGDRVEALFRIFLGRPPFAAERSDLGRLYHLWDNGYFDHPNLQLRLPDAVVRYRCLDENGEIDASTSGECTSILYGFEQLVLKPDLRAQLDERDNLTMWSGLLTADEWEKLQAPGRLVAQERLFWENAATRVLTKYLGYDLGHELPRVREELVKYALEYDGDIRALHFAVLTSMPYRQSTTGVETSTARFSYGPLKQAEAEGWVDSVARVTGVGLSACDYRLNRPNEFLDVGNPNAYALVADSDWELNDSGEGVRGDYADLVQTLGGCPDNSGGGRFKIISVLTTVNQLNFVGRICNPGNSDRFESAPVETLLPSGMTARQVVDAQMATDIVTHQVHTFFGREPTEAEVLAAQTAGVECARTTCQAEDFARPACFALLSSSEMLFY